MGYPARGLWAGPPSPWLPRSHGRRCANLMGGLGPMGCPAHDSTRGCATCGRPRSHKLPGAWAAPPSHRLPRPHADPMGCHDPTDCAHTMGCPHARGCPDAPIRLAAPITCPPQCVAPQGSCPNPVGCPDAPTSPLIAQPCLCRLVRQNSARAHRIAQPAPGGPQHFGRWHPVATATSPAHRGGGRMSGGTSAPTHPWRSVSYCGLVTVIAAASHHAQGLTTTLVFPKQKAPKHARHGQSCT